MSPVSSGQRWSPRGRSWPRGQILKSLALASRPQVLKNWPVLGSRTALFFELLKFRGALEKFFGKRFFVEIAWKIFVKTFFFFEIAWKIFVKTFFFWRALALVSLVLGLGLEHSCPWPRECLSSERLSLAPWPWPRALCPRLHLCFRFRTWKLLQKFGIKSGLIQKRLKYGKNISHGYML